MQEKFNTFLRNLFKVKCSECGIWINQRRALASGWVVDYHKRLWLCDNHKKKPDIWVKPKIEGRARITDATGKIRDRDWLNKKLYMTSTEKRWHEDIKSRRIMPDGSVARFKSGKRVG